MTVNQNLKPPLSATLMQMIFGFALSRSIAVAAQLGVADQLKDGPKSIDDLARAVGADSRSLYRMLRALASAGVFAERADGSFNLTPLGELLRGDHPETLRGFAAMMANAVNFETWAELPYSVGTGKPAFPHKFGTQWFSWLEENPDEGKVFHDAMTSLSAGAVAAVVSSYDFSGIKNLVDVGGGHGLLLASVLAKYPTMHGVLYDDPNVVAGAREILAAHGVEERCESVGGNFFESVPAGGDAYILKHIIHDWSDEECLTILSHCHAGMSTGNKVLIVEMVVPERNQPGVSKFLDLEMLLFLTGRERTEAEYRVLLDRAGFEMTRIVPTPSPYGVVEGVKK
jgi:O-methyltransferase/methyltransferase family protein